MITTFEFDPKRAAKAGDIARNLLQKGSGFYKLTIQQADIEQVDSGAQCLHLWVTDEFECPTSFNLWLYGKDGSRLFGHNFLDAIMGLLEIETITAKPSKVYSWRDPKNTPPIDGQRLVELEKKTIGMVLQRVIDHDHSWEDSDGVKRPSVSFQILHVCNPVTLKTYSEMSADTEATLVLDCLAKLKDRVIGEA